MLKINEKAFAEPNWANLLTDSQRAQIASDLISDIELDKASRSDWLDSMQDWIDLAMQVRDAKSYPWLNASNIKYPLLTTASMQFHSRAQQALLKGRKPIKAKILGKDPTGQKTERGTRLEEYMGYLLLDKMEDWEDELDRMLMILPIVGLAFKKIYYSTSRTACRSELVLPNELILNYNATDFGRARRTHMMTRFHNEIVELQRQGFFLDEELVKPRDEGDEPDRSREERVLYESHCWLDLDEDGYEEPYMVTIDVDTQTMLRISPRFGEDDVEYNGKTITKIEPIEFFVRYIFLPSADSKLYGVGLGTLLGPTNMAVNTLINQLVDAGSLAVLPSGFLGRGARLSRSGNQRFSPGEWKTISSTGDDLRKSIFPLPVKEPSGVLFNLLGTLIDSGKQIGSVADIMMGENPGQNQPYSTTAAVLEQGMKVFVGIYKRVYRSLTLEYTKLINLAMMYEQASYQNFFDQPQVSIEQDFSPDDLSLVPVSDPELVSEAAQILKSESLLQKLMAGLPLNPTEVTRRLLEAENHENVELLMQVPQPQPDPELMLKAAEMKGNLELEYARMEKEVPLDQANMMKDIAQAMVNFAKAKSVGNSDTLAENQQYAEAYLKRRAQDIDTAKIGADLAKTKMTADSKANDAQKTGS